MPNLGLSELDSSDLIAYIDAMTYAKRAEKQAPQPHRHHHDIDKNVVKPGAGRQAERAELPLSMRSSYFGAIRISNVLRNTSDSSCVTL